MVAATSMFSITGSFIPALMPGPDATKMAFIFGSVERNPWVPASGFRFGTTNASPEGSRLEGVPFLGDQDQIAHGRVVSR